MGNLDVVYSSVRKNESWRLFVRMIAFLFKLSGTALAAGISVLSGTALAAGSSILSGAALSAGSNNRPTEPRASAQSLTTV